MKHALMGIDVGSTSTKVAVVDVNTREPVVIEQDTLRPTLSAPAGYHEEDPVRLRAACVALISRAASVAREKGYSVAGLCFTGQMHGGLVVDDALTPLTSFVTWQDKRGDERSNGRTVQQEFKARVSANALEGLGTEVHTGFLVVTLDWMIKHGSLPATGWKAIGIYDWIAATLSDGPLTSDPSSAAAWGAYSLRDRRYSEEVLAALGLTDAHFPIIKEIGEVIGHVTASAASETGLTAGTPIYNGMGDTQSSFIGSTTSDHELLLNFGTGSQLLWTTKSFARYRGTDIRHLTRDTYLMTVPTLAGGQAYAILALFFKDVVHQLTNEELDRIEVFTRMNRLAEAAADAAVTFTPFFNGSRTYGQDLRASIMGLDRDNFTMSTLTRSLLHGMVEELAEPYFALPESERHHTGLVGSGNGIKFNVALQRVASKRFGLPIRTSPYQEEAAIGAALRCIETL